MKTAREQAREMRELLTQLVSQIDKVTDKVEDESDEEYANYRIARTLGRVAFRCDELAYDYKYGCEILRASEIAEMA